MSIFRRSSASAHRPEGGTPTNNAADAVAQLIASTFSYAYFENCFDGIALPDGWSKDDALGVWYSLGNLALVVAAWSNHKGDSARAIEVIGSVRSDLLNRWNMSSTSSNRLLAFANRTEAESFRAFHSCTNGAQLASFFGRYVSNILGSPVALTSHSSFEDELQGIVFAECDPILVAALADRFVETVASAKNLLRESQMLSLNGRGSNMVR